MKSISPGTVLVKKYGDSILTFSTSERDLKSTRNFIPANFPDLRFPKGCPLESCLQFLDWYLFPNWSLCWANEKVSPKPLCQALIAFRRPIKIGFLRKFFVLYNNNLLPVNRVVKIKRQSLLMIVPASGF